MRIHFKHLNSEHEFVELHDYVLNLLNHSNLSCFAVRELKLHRFHLKVQLLCLHQDCILFLGHIRYAFYNLDFLIVVKLHTNQPQQWSD